MNSSQVSRRSGKFGQSIFSFWAILLSHGANAKLIRLTTSSRGDFPFRGLGLNILEWVIEGNSFHLLALLTGQLSHITTREELLRCRNMQGENAITVRFSEAPKNKNRVKPSKDGCKKFQEALRLGDTGRFQAPAPLAGFVSHLFDLTEPNVLSDQKALDFLQAIGFPTKYVEVIGGRVRRCFRRERAQYEATQKRPRVFAREDADLEGLEHPEAYKPFLPGIVSREPTAQESPKGLDIPIIRLLPRPDPFLYYSSRHPDDVDKSFKVNPGAEEDRYPEPLSVIRANLNMLLAHFRKAEVAQELTSLLQDDILPGEGILRLPDVGCLPKSNVEQRARDHFAPGCVVKVSSWLGVVVAEILYLWANGFRLRRCFFCRNYFVPQPTQVRLCSDRCEKGQAGARVRKSRKKQAPCVT